METLLNDFDTEKLSIRRKSLFSLVRTVVDVLTIPVLMTYFHLLKRTESENDLLHWIHHMLTDEQQLIWFEFVKSLLRLHENHYRISFHDAMTEDELWFLHDYDDMQI
jgi:hypothetical protein